MLSLPALIIIILLLLLVVRQVYKGKSVNKKDGKQAFMITKHIQFKPEVTPADLISIVSVILVIATLFEMGKERSSAYMPHVVFEYTAQSTSWRDATEYTYYLGRIDEDGKYTNTTRDSYSDPYYNEVDVLKSIPFELYLRNIGIGAAKDVVISLDRGSLRKHIRNYKASLENSMVYKLVNGGMVYSDRTELAADNKSYVGNEHSIESSPIRYMVSDPDNSILYVLPSIYGYLFLDMAREYYRDNPEKKIFTDSVILNITYRDMQDKAYSQKYLLTSTSTIKGNDGDDDNIVIEISQKVKRIDLFEQIAYYLTNK